MEIEVTTGAPLDLVSSELTTKEQPDIVSDGIVSKEDNYSMKQMECSRIKQGKKFAMLCLWKKECTRDLEDNLMKHDSNIMYTVAKESECKGEAVNLEHAERDSLDLIQKKVPREEIIVFSRCRVVLLRKERNEYGQWPIGQVTKLLSHAEQKDVRTVDGKKYIRLAGGLCFLTLRN